MAAEQIDDSEFQEMIRRASLLALDTQIELMTTGTPENRVRAAAAFNSVLQRALGAGEGEDEIAEAKAKMRRVIGGMLVRKKGRE